MYQLPSWRKQPQHGFEEKGYLWKDVSPWDAKWPTLSPAARLAFIQDVKAAAATGRSTVVSITPEKLARKSCTNC